MYVPYLFLNNVIIYDGARTKFMHRDPFKSQTYFYNNVFYNKSTTTTTTWHDTARYQSNLGEVTFSNNCFYEASGIHSQYEPADPNKITSNPMLLSPGQPPVRNEAGLLSGASIWEGYKLTEASPLIDAGIYVPEMGTQDFFGNSLYYGNAPDIGVHENREAHSLLFPQIWLLGKQSPRAVRIRVYQQRTQLTALTTKNLAGQPRMIRCRSGSSLISEILSLSIKLRLQKILYLDGRPHVLQNLNYRFQPSPVIHRFMSMQERSAITSPVHLLKQLHRIFAL